MRRPLGLAVVVLGLVAGNAHAATPDLAPGPDLYPQVAVEANVPIRLSDGVTLRARVTHPATANVVAAPGRFPAILTQTPYNKGAGVLGPSDIAALVRNGYVSVTVDVRGTGNSEGDWDSFGPREQHDSGEIVGWMGKQAWYDGRFGTYGPSYMAINQFHTAARTTATRAATARAPS